MTNMLGLLRLIFVLIILCGSFTTVVLALRKDVKYVGNRLLALAFLMVGIFGVSMLIHEGFPTVEVVSWTDRLNYSLIMWGVSFLFLTMQVIVNTSSWLDERRHVIPVIILDIAFTVLLFAWSDALSVESLAPVNTKTSIIVNIILGAGLLYFILFSIYAVYVHGIKKTEGARRAKMKIVCAGFIGLIGAFVVNVGSNLVESPELGSLFDVIYFAVFAGAMTLVAVGFLRPAE